MLAPSHTVRLALLLQHGNMTAMMRGLMLTDELITLTGCDEDLYTGQRALLCGWGGLLLQHVPNN